MKLHQYITTPLLRECSPPTLMSIVRCTCICRSTASSGPGKPHGYSRKWQPSIGPREPNDHAQSEMLANCTRIITIARELKR